ncbi:MAG: aldo/keto reductase [Rhodospirillales bacterium]
MKYRPLGRSGVLVSEIGFGAWGIGGATPGATSYGLTDDDVSLRALRYAVEDGITFFDTSSAYGYGHSEKLIGQAFKGFRGKVVIATKAGILRYGEPPDFSPKFLRRSLEASLARLQTDYVDLFQLHNPPTATLNDCGKILEIADALRQEGKIRSFGVSVRTPEDGYRAIQALRPDAIQVNFNLLDQRIIDSGLLHFAGETDTALIARTPLCFGFLTGTIDADTRFDERDHRSRWPRTQIKRWAVGGRRMRNCMTLGDGETESQFALRFCLSFPEVASVIPGMLTEEEVRENVQASRLGPLLPSLQKKIAKVYCEIELFGDDAPADLGKVATH